MILLRSFWKLNFIQMCLWSRFMFSSKVLESCANKLVWYLFETLPVATCFNLEPMVLLIVVNVRKVSKIGSMLSKIKKVRKLWQVCCNLDELPPIFPQLRFEYFIGSMLKSLEFLFFQNFRRFEQKLRLVCQTTYFFVVSRIFGCFWGQFQ